MKQLIKALINRVPYIRNLSEQEKMQGAFPPGHYYSPIPTKEDVLDYVESRKPPSNEVLGVDLNEQGQRQLLDEYADYYKELPFPEKQTPEFRYYYDNVWFSYSDAIFLYSFLRKHKPKKIVEVGSGFSSAVMLDTIDRFFPERPEITFVEPFPDRLISLFKEDDRQQVRLIDKKIQDVPLDIFLALESGDLLFIDSSHVVKCGSDLHLLMFEILPRLQPGVMVHFHDVFYPFDYPSEWLLEGRYWNENYFLRAFLSYNSAWSIQFFNTYVHHRFGDVIQEKMPLCVKNTGGGLYLRRE
ncbi:MAG: class I SAM-dependent methyltransferase [Methylococcales bacterium]|nr:class I SAM-dependent methyltransferase [Methylococcales bacterium]